MKGLDFLEKMNDIDYEFIEASNNYKKNRNTILFKWTAVAASFIIMAIVAKVIYPGNNHSASLVNESMVISVNGKNYECASIDKLIQYGIVTDIGRGTTEDVDYTATADECGQLIGSVDVLIDGKIVKGRAYKHICNNDDVCLVEYPDNVYKIYVVKEK